MNQSLSSPVEYADRAIVTTSLHMEVASRLREQIVSGEFAPGSKIRELHVCGWLGVSRTPLREALKLLSSEGFVVLTPNRGCHVAHPTDTSIRERRQMIVALECYAIGELCENLDESALAELKSVHAALMRSIEDGDISAFVEANARFHQGIIEQLGNSTIAETYKLQMAHLAWARLLSGRTTGYIEEAGKEHEEIMRAIMDRDAVRAREAVSAHHWNLDLRSRQNDRGDSA